MIYILFLFPIKKLFYFLMILYVPMKNSMQETNTLLRLLEETSDAIFSKDKYDTIISWNKGAEIMFGYTKKETIGTNCINLNLFNITQQEYCAIANHLKEVGEWQEEFDLNRKNNIPFQGAVTANAIKNDNNEVMSTLFIIKDITSSIKLDKKREEKVQLNKTKLDLSENRFKALVVNSHEAFSMMDENFTIFYRSPASTKITGWEVEELLGKDGAIITHPDDLELQVYLKSECIKNPGKPIPIEYRFLHKNGEYRWLKGTLLNLLHDDTVKAIVINYIDYTEKHIAEQKLIASENKFRALVENGSDLIVTFDKDFKVIYRSPSNAKVTGWTDEDIMGANAINVVHPDDVEYVAAYSQKVLNNPGVHIDFSFRMMTKDCRFIWVEGLTINLLDDKHVNAIVSNFSDVTDKKQQQDKLAASERKFRALIENSNDVITLFDDMFRVIYRSPSNSKVTGWKDEEIMGEGVADKVHPDDIDGTYKLIQEVIQQPDLPVHFQARCLNKAGEYRWVAGSMVNKLYDKDIKAVVCNYRDITEEKTGQDKLAANELRLRSLLENGNDYIMMFDANHKVIFRSKSGENLLGRIENEKANKSIYHHIHPEDQMLFKELLEKVEAKPGIRLDISFRMLHKKGHSVWIKGAMINWLEDKNIQAIVFNFSDVSEKVVIKEELEFKEEQYQKLVEEIKDAFFMLDNDLKIIYINKIAAGIFNCPPHELIGQNPYDVFLDAKNGDIYEALLKAIATKESANFESYSVMFQKWLQCSIYPSDKSVSCFVKDITDKKLLEDKLRKKQIKEQTRILKAALDAQEKERNFIGIELHDNVNQILVGTTMVLSMLKKKPGKDDELITESIGHIKQAINENRKLAHVLVSPDLNAKDFEEQLNFLCKDMLHNASIKTTSIFENYEDTLLSVDQKIALYRMVQEQFTNIIKYAHATEVNITISIHAENVLKMKIQDNGKGMDMNAVTNGIGFRNIKSRLSIYDGKMNIQTQPGKGFMMEIEMLVGK